MKKTHVGRIVQVATLLICFIAFLTTCKNNIGLGGTVDVKPPTIKNDSVYPPNNAIIKGSFKLAVKADDDTGVDAVTAVITTADTHNSKINIGKAFLQRPSSNDGYWTLDIDPKGEYPIGDGDYKLEIQATDTAGKVATVTSAFTIDNTPPLLILNRPSTAIEANETLANSTPDVFGADFLLVGQVYDESAVPTLKITAEGNGQKREKTLNNIPQNIRITVDSFGSKTDDPFYKPLYNGEENGGTKKYEYGITVTDSAKEYNNPGNAGTGTGNTTNRYYLFDDLYKPVLSAYKIQDVYAMLRGTYNSELGWMRSVAASDLPQDVKKALQDYQLGGGGAKTGTFALNPSLNPRFAIAGEEATPRPSNPSATPSFSPLYSGSSLKVKISRNLDGVPLEGTDTYRFFLMKWSDFLTYTGSSPYPTEKINDTGADSIYANETTQTLKPGLVGKLIPMSNLSFQIEGSNYLVTLPISESLGIAYSNNYVLLVRGKDQNGNKLIPDLTKVNGGAYGFYFVENGKAPEVYVTKIKGSASGHETNGTGTDPDPNKKNITERVYLKKYDGMVVTVHIGGGGSNQSLQYELKGTVGGDVTQIDIPVVSNTITIPSGKFDQDVEKTYTLTVRATASTGNSLLQTYYIVYDVKEPEADITTLVNNAVINETNGTAFSVSGTAFDTGIGLENVSVKLSKIDGNGTFTDRALTVTTADGRWSTEAIDLSVVSDTDPKKNYGEGKYTLTMTATDKLGWKKSITRTFYFDKKAPEITNLKVNGESVVNGGTVYTNTTPVVVTGNVTESYGIETFTINGDGSGLPSTTGTVNKTLNLTEGRYSNVAIVLVDKAGQSAPDFKFDLVVDTTAPVFETSTSAAPADQIQFAGKPASGVSGAAAILTSNNPLEVTGLIKGPVSGIKKVLYVVTEKTVTTAPSTGWQQLNGTPDSNGNYRLSGFVQADGEKKVWIKAVDNAGNETVFSHGVKVVPAAVITWTLELENGASLNDTVKYNAGTWYAKGQFKVKIGGKSNSAPTGGSPMNVEIKQGSTTKALTDFFGDWTGREARIYPTNSPDTYTVKSGQTEGEYTIKISAQGQDKLLTFTIDGTAPTIMPDSSVPADNTWVKTKALSVSGTATDATSGIEKIEAIVNGTATVLGTTSPWSGYLTLNEGNNTVQFKVTDKAGNSNDPTSAPARTIKLDTGLPTITLTTPANGQALVNRTSTSYQVTVTVSDTGGSGIAKVEYDTTSGFASTPPLPSATPMGGVATINLTGINGDTTYYFRAVDNAGNASDSVRVSIQKDSTGPTITFDSPQNSQIVNKTITIKGTASDTNGLQSVKIVKSDGTELVGVSASSGAVSGDSETAANKALFKGVKAYNWQFDLDTVSYSDTSGMGTITLKAIATDTAGNTTEKILTLNVDQNSDRPVATVTSFNTIGNAQLSGSGTVMLTGTISDDDGTVQSLKVKVGNGSYEPVTFSTGKTSWTYEIPSTVAEGTAVSLDFEVKDANNTVFTTGDAHGALHRPKVKGISDPEAAFKDDAITFNFDKTRPEIKQAFFNLGTSFATTGTEVGSNQVIGNNNNRKASFKVLAKDTSGIQKVKLTLGAKSKEVTVKTGTETVSSIEYEVWKLEDIELTEGNHVLRIEATDKAGFSNEWQQSVIVDFTAPEIKHLSPSLNGVYFKEVELTGQITDKPFSTGQSVSGVDDTSAVYKIGNSGYGTSHSAGSEELSKLTCSSGTWTVAIKDIAKYKDYGATLVTGTLYKVEIKLKVRDKAGNETPEKIYTLTFDPNGGTPSLEVLTPAADAKIGGSVAISGTAQVANAASGKRVKEVYLQLSKTPIASSATSVPSLVLDTHEYGGAEGYKIKDDSNGIGYWSCTLSEAAVTTILNGAAEQDVYFRVRGKNNETPAVVGEWSPVRKFKLSTDIAKFADIKLTKPAPNPVDMAYADSGDTWLTDDNFKIEGKVTHSFGIAEDIKAETKLPIENGSEPLDTTGNASWFTPITNGYKFVIPIKTTDKKTGTIEFDITAKDGRDSNATPVSQKISLKYDRAKPAVVFGKAKGKFANVQISSTEADGVSVEVPSGKTLAETITELHKNVKNLYLFVETNDSSAKAIPVKTITASGAAAKVTFDSQGNIFSGSPVGLLIEKPTIVFDGASDYQLTGYAYDLGSKLKEIAVSMGTKTDTITSFTNETSSFISFQQGFKTKKNGTPGIGIDDSGYTLTLTPTDKAGNIGAVDSSAVSVRNTPLKITEVFFNSDLNDDGAYANNATTGLVETVKRSGGDEFLTTERNYAQEIDIKADFTIKNKDKSQIKFTLDSTQTASTFEIYKDNLSGTALTSGNIAGNAINFSASDFGNGKIGDGDGQKFIIVLKDAASTTDMERKLTLTVTMNVKINDTRKPSVFVAPFYWNGEGDNSLASNDRTKGHIEIKAVSGGGGTSDVSGKVVIRGTAYHPAKLSKLELTVPGVTGTLTSEYKKVGTVVKWDGTGLKVTDKRLDLNGHWVNWEYEWTTGDVAVNQAITLRAYHGTSTVSDAILRAGTRKDAQARDSQQSLTLAAGDSAVVGQFLRIIDATGTDDGDQSYLVAITSVEGSVVKWENVLIPTTVNKYYLYPREYTGNQPEFNQPTLKVNVVPYITGIVTAKRTNSGLSKNTIRASNGKYSVIKGSVADFIEVKGFNLQKGSETPVVKLVKAADMNTVSSATGGTSVTSSSYSKTGFKVSNNLAHSGYLEVFVDGVRAINNINANTKPYNKEEDAVLLKNKTLTDDRYLRVFDMKETDIKNGYYPEMIMDGNDPVFGYLDLSGYHAINGVLPKTLSLYFEGGYQFQRAKFNAAGTRQSIEYLAGAIAWDQLAMAKDAAGRYHYISMYNYRNCSMCYIYDRYAELHKWASNSYTDGWGPGGGYSGYGGVFAYHADNNALALDSANYQSLLIDRYQYPKLIVKGNSMTGVASVYMAYYDANTTDKQIVFRNFQVGQHGSVQGGTKYRLYNSSGYNQYTNLAENTGNVATYNTGRLTAASSASQYFDLGVTSDNHIVLVYFDEAAGKLKLKYSAAAVNGSNPTGTISWTTSAVDFPDYTGTYVSMDIDSNNGIHIAAFDSGDGDLKYFYLSSYGNTDLKSMTVDAAFSVGQWTQIKVRNGKPYIAYYNNTEAGQRSSIKLAVAEGAVTTTGSGGIGTIETGVNEQGFVTGKWDCMTVPSVTPAQGGSLKFKKVNLGFDTSGRPVLGYLGENIEFGKWVDE